MKRNLIEIDVKQIIGNKHSVLLANGGCLNESVYKWLHAVCEPITPETTNWYYQVTVGKEPKLETTSLRAAVEEYNKY